MYRLMMLCTVIVGCGGSHPPAPAPPTETTETTEPPAATETTEATSSSGAQTASPEVVDKSYRDWDQEQIRDIGMIRFEGRTAKIAFNEGLYDLKDYFDKHPLATLVRIGAHTGEIGEPAARMQLTKDRALAVAHALVAQGVDCHRILPVGFGSTQLPDYTNAFHPPDDRIEAFKVGLSGHQLGDRPEGSGEIAGDPCAQ